MARHAEPDLKVADAHRPSELLDRTLPSRREFMKMLGAGVALLTGSNESTEAAPQQTQGFEIGRVYNLTKNFTDYKKLVNGREQSRLYKPIQGSSLDFYVGDASPSALRGLDKKVRPEELPYANHEGQHAWTITGIKGKVNEANAEILGFRPLRFDNNEFLLFAKHGDDTLAVTIKIDPKIKRFSDIQAKLSEAAEPAIQKLIEGLTPAPSFIAGLEAVGSSSGNLLLGNKLIEIPSPDWNRMLKTRLASPGRGVTDDNSDLSFEALRKITDGIPYLRHEGDQIGAMSIYGAEAADYRETIQRSGYNILGVRPIDFSKRQFMLFVQDDQGKVFGLPYQTQDNNPETIKNGLIEGLQQVQKLTSKR